MLIIFIIIVSIMIFVSVKITKNTKKEGIYDTFLTCLVINGFLLLFLLGALFFLINDIVSASVIDKKIAMLQEENTLIEQELTSIVNSYKDYEKEVINNVGQMATILITFPELKTNELVIKQMDIYVKNNDKIKSLKESKIDAQTSKWWVYFGG